jgi:hypothetical protein
LHWPAHTQFLNPLKVNQSLVQGWPAGFWRWPGLGYVHISNCLSGAVRLWSVSAQANA